MIRTGTFILKKFKTLDLTHLINYELPNVAETYVHRIGRTGRAGAGGIAYSFCDWSEKIFLSDIQMLTKKKIPVVKSHLYDVPGMHDIVQPMGNFYNVSMRRKRNRTFMQGS